MKRTLLITVATAMIYLATTSSSMGPTNSGGAAPAVTGCGTATSCHGAASTNTTAEFYLFEKSSGDTVKDGKYTPNETYDVALRGINNSAGMFGFIMRSEDNNAAQAGTFTNPLSGSTLTNSGGFTLWEHTNPFFSSGQDFVVTAEWTAPAAGTGDVTFQYAVNGVNSDGGTKGDHWNKFSTTFSEKTSVSVAEVENIKPISIYPNPASSIINIEGAGKGVSYSIYGLDGVLICNGILNSKGTIDIAALPSNTYFIKLSSKDILETIPFIKK